MRVTAHNTARTVLAGGRRLRQIQHRSACIAIRDIEARFRPGWTFSVPNKRSYARVLREYDGVMLSFVRPVADGRVLSVSSVIRELLISAVPASTILAKLVEEPDWSARQTPGGVFMTRFIERLGGPEAPSPTSRAPAPHSSRSHGANGAGRQAPSSKA